MEQWHCFKCKEKMVVGDVEMAYLEMLNSVEGIKCPRCNAAYLLEKKVVEEIVPGEQMIETK